jgi:formylglycine-generating enzyme required for sulfatase activity
VVAKEQSNCPTCELERPVVGWPRPPFRFENGYDLLAELDRDVSGVVYLASREFIGCDQLHRELLTLKVSTRFSTSKEACEAFRRELFDNASNAVGMERTNHGIPYLVLELADPTEIELTTEEMLDVDEAPTHRDSDPRQEKAAEELRREIERLETELEGVRTQAVETTSSHAEALEQAKRRWKDEQSARHRAEAAMAAELARAELPSGPVVLRLSQKLLSWVSARFVRVLPGTFVMGSPLEEAGRLEARRDSPSAPSSERAPINFEQQHEVTLSRPYLIGTTQVTQAQFESVLGFNPSDFKGPKLPVESVSWYDAVMFCNRLSEQQGMPESSWAYTIREVRGKPGQHDFEMVVEWRGPECEGYRLPTEAEWEHACRAGSTTATYNGDLDTAHLKDEQPNPVLDSIAWFGGNSDSSSQRVATKTPNEWGLYDMLGNVWEWVWDWDEMYPSAPILDPIGPDTGENRVIRGGSWSLYARFCRASYRGRDWPGHRFNDIGFRVARTIL